MYIRNDKGLGLKNRPELTEGDISQDSNGFYIFKGRYLSSDYVETLKTSEAQRIIANANNFTIGKNPEETEHVTVVNEQQENTVVKKQQTKKSKGK